MTIRLSIAFWIIATAASSALGEEWATLKGRVVCDFYEAPPVHPKFDSKKYPDCDGPILDRSLLIDETTRGLQNVLVYAVVRPSRVHDSYDDVPAEVVSDLENCEFTPRVFVVQLGKQQLWLKNSSTTTHNKYFDPGRGNNPVNMLLQPGGELKVRASNPLSTPFDVRCSIHPWLSAHGLYLNHPYFAVTKADGTFEIKNLPQGEEMSFRVWHERFGFYKNVDGKSTSPSWPLTLDGDVEAPDIRFKQADLK